MSAESEFRLSTALSVEYRNSVNQLLDLLVDLSGFARSSKYYWGLVLVGRELCHYSPRVLLTDTAVLARSAWLTWQMTFAVLSIRFPEWSAEAVGDELLRLFCLYDDLDCANGLPLCTPEKLYALPYRPMRAVPSLHSKADVQASRWLERVSLSDYPRLPSSKYLSRIATTKLLRQGYFAGNYPRLQRALSLFSSDVRVRLTFEVPQSVAVQFRLMALMAQGRPDDFAACVILYAWERLGRSILHSAGGAKDLTQAFDYFINNPTTNPGPDPDPDPTPTP